MDVAGSGGKNSKKELWNAHGGLWSPHIDAVLDALQGWVDTGGCRDVLRESRAPTDYYYLADLFDRPAEFFKTCLGGEEDKLVGFILAVGLLTHRSAQNAPTLECLAGVRSDLFIKESGSGKILVTVV